MKVLHLNAGNETGGGLVHILSLLGSLNKDEVILGVFEKGKMYEEAKKRGIQVVYFSQKNRYDFSVLKKIREYIIKKEINIIHSHGARANLFSILIKKIFKMNEYKWVTTLHSNPSDDFMGEGVKGRLFTNAHLLALQHFDHYFAISLKFKELLINKGVPNEKITTIYNGIDFKDVITEEDYEVKRLANISDDDFIITMIARLHPVKRHYLAIDSVRELIDKHSNIKLILVGDGPLEEEIRRKVNEYNLEKNIYLIGFKKNVNAILKLSDILLLTSLSESFPLVILEAARLKKTVITTDVGGVRDLIIDNRFGWVTQNDDLNTIKNAIEDAIVAKKNGELNQKGELLHKRASENFSLEQFKSSIFKTYKMLIKQNQ